MFEHCNTTEELAKARISALQSGISAVDVNSGYSLARKRLIAKTPKKFARIPVIKPAYELPEYGGITHICGKTGSPNTMVIAEEGIYAG